MLSSTHMYKDLTPKQKGVLVAIREFMNAKGKTPTIEELRKRLGYRSPNSISQLLKALEEKGFIERTNQRERNIAVEIQGETVQVPIVGNITCGLPILAQQNIEGYIPISRDFLRGDEKNFFILRASGNSLDKAGIKDGDYVLVRSQQAADPGSRVVALIDDEATIKIYKPTKNYVALVPKSSDPSHKPIILSRDFLIQGVVKRVIRKESLEV
jgi:repressor LexA